jgi:hypothetical protein
MPCAKHDARRTVRRATWKGKTMNVDDCEFLAPHPLAPGCFILQLPTVGALSCGDGKAPELLHIPAGVKVRPVGEEGQSRGAFFVENFRGLVHPRDEHYAEYCGIRVGPEIRTRRASEAPKLRNTNGAAFRATVRAYLQQACEGGMGAAEDAFAAEYDHPANIRRTPDKQARVAEWLAGLPAACGVEYRNGAIIEIAEWWHGVGGMTERQKDRIISNWFNFCAFHLVRAWDAAPADHAAHATPRP